MKKTKKQACFPAAACEPALLKELEKYAEREDTSKSAVIRQAVRFFLSAKMPKSTLN